MDPGFVRWNGDGDGKSWLGWMESGVVVFFFTRWWVRMFDEIFQNLSLISDYKDIKRKTYKPWHFGMALPAL